MSEQASNIAREAKDLHQGLKEILKAREPWDKEVEFQRKNLRRRYLNLLFVHPYAKESKDVENHLWMQTSYAFISVYKQRITALDRVIQNAARHRNQPHQGGHGPVEHRRLIQRFRQFLSDEEKFWTQLVVRFRRSFALDEAQPALLALGIPTTSDATAIANSRDAPEARDGGASTTNGRSHQFPPEDATVSVEPKTVAEREGRLAILSKALICLGDIARYRELYNESNGRPKAGHEDNGPRRGRNRRGGPAGMDAIPRARNYDKAQQCYEQAKLLVPYDGNPSHQLAILASYEKDSFSSLLHYYRALCVRQPYDTASENLGTVLTKALEQWKTRIKRERNNGDVVDPNMATIPRVRIEVFKEKLVVLHALWRVGVEKMDSISPNHGQGVLDDFKFLVSERHFPIDMISNVIVLSQGALWKHRMIRDPIPTSRKSEASPPSAASIAAIESRIFFHSLALHRALLEVGLDELKEPPPIDAAENDLAQRITATFRRTLPALRIASKWFRANYKYVMQEQDLNSIRQSEEEETKINGSSNGVPRFWEVYAEFSRTLARAFPEDRLPSLDALLEEDVEMRGFLPLRKMMGEAKAVTEGSADREKAVAAQGQAQEQVHPNVEQLMRIWDLLDDAKSLVEMEKSPLALYGKAFVLKGVEAEVHPLPPSVSHNRNPEEDAVPIPQQQLLSAIRDDRLVLRKDNDLDDDALTEVTSRTDDEVVRDAFRFLDGSDQSEEPQDEIVWDPRATISPILGSPPSRPSPITPKRPMMSPIGPTARSPTLSKSISPLTTPAAVPMSPTTAQDLLNDVMGVSRSSNGGDLIHSESSAPQPQLLFGSGPPNHADHSIWSTSLDIPLKFKGGSQTGHSYPSHTRQFSGSMSQDMSQSIWSSSHTDASQNPQNHLVGALPANAFVPQPYPMVAGGHQRIPSSSMTASQLYANQNYGLPDPYGYAPPIAQQPIHRPKDHHAPTPAAYPNMPMATTSGTDLYYGNGALQGYHGRHAPSLHSEPGVGQAYVPSPISPVWGNVG